MGEPSTDVLPTVASQASVPQLVVTTVAPSCVCCKALVEIEDESVTCTQCNSAYHSDCAKRLHRSSEGVFKRCCSSRKASPNRDVGFSLDELMRAMRAEFNPKLQNINDTIDVKLAGIDRKIDSKWEAMNAMIDDKLGLINAKVNESQSAVMGLTGRVGLIEGDITDIKTRIHTVESAAASGDSSGDANVMRACLSEWEDRCARKHNLIIKGVPESGLGDGTARLTADRNSCISLLGALGYPLSHELSNPLKCYRIGKFSPNLREPRHLKLTLPHSLSVITVLQKFIKAKKDGSLQVNLRSLVIFLDKTPAQRVEYRRAKEELLRRSQTGETGLRLTTKNGFPTIIRASARRENLQPQPSAPPESTKSAAATSQPKT